jgi:hypothetical protein
LKKEEAYDPETDRARFEAQQRAWREGRGGEMANTAS